ncbi:MAG: spermidine synthase [Gemmatimonadetes bacterium]|nr:spermidine synthase [Gemmatimonadota bacterium]
MKPFVRLGTAHTPSGTKLEFFRHDRDYVIWADGIELMSTRRHYSEDRLAELACAPLTHVPGARVLVGGLGLGFTLKAALRHLGTDAEAVVAELVPEVIAWNAEASYGLAYEAMSDPRVQVVQADVVEVLRAQRAAFDAIMLDTDNGPDGMLMKENASLYSSTGIASTIAALRPGGRIAYWSVGEDRAFVGALQRAGLVVETFRERAHATSGPKHVLFLATPRLTTGRD